MKSKRSGFTVIELILTLGLIIILLFSLSFIFLYINKQFISAAQSNLCKYYGDEALAFIEKQLRYDTLKMDVMDDKLILYKENRKRDIIELEDEKLIIWYGDIFSMSSTKNIIIEKVKDFDVSKDRNIVFVTITMEDGRSKERCLYLKD